MLADVDVTLELARELLRAQHPDLADQPLRIAANGWDNVVVRLGDDLSLRLPRRQVAAQLVRNEQAVLADLAPVVGVPVPVPVRVGSPEPGLYPYPWSVVPWFDGVPALSTPVERRTAWAGALGSALAALHAVPAPADAPVNPVRGVPLAQRDDAFRARLDAATAGPEPLVDAWTARVLRDQWDAGLAAPVYDGRPVWLHGDPHPGNVVVRPGDSEAPDALAALVDFGDVTSGDPASDLATGWLTFDAPGLAAFRAAAVLSRHDDPALWARARAWAASFSLVMLENPADHPAMAAVGRHAAARLVADT